MSTLPACWSRRIPWTIAAALVGVAVGVGDGDRVGVGVGLADGVVTGATVMRGVYVEAGGLAAHPVSSSTPAATAASRTAR
ncbi:MAG TPA: hypothetical protein VGO26_07500 [Amnibacterium sp.]|nr:hypothetical protein [Amnibacterium sp.]